MIIVTTALLPSAVAAPAHSEHRPESATWSRNVYTPSARAWKLAFHRNGANRVDDFAALAVRWVDPRLPEPSGIRPRRDSAPGWLMRLNLASRWKICWIVTACLRARARHLISHALDACASSRRPAHGLKLASRAYIVRHPAERAIPSITRPVRVTIRVPGRVAEDPFFAVGLAIGVSEQRRPSSRAITRCYRAATCCAKSREFSSKIRI